MCTVDGKTVTLQRGKWNEKGIIVAIFKCNVPQATEEYLEDCLGNVNLDQTPHFLG